LGGSELSSIAQQELAPCIGQHLARAEKIALFKELLSRLEHVELAGEPRWTETSFLGGLKRLPIGYRAPG
jgi:cytochrome P450